MAASSPALPARASVTSAVARLEGPFALDGGQVLDLVDIAYTIAGTPAPDGGNVVLVCHALTGDQHVMGPHPVTGRDGWWARMVGPGRPVDPARHLIVCANVLGSCMGTTGPSSIDPATGTAWGMRFPVITIADMARMHLALLDHLGIARLAAVIGGSMGGMQALQLAVLAPDRVDAVIAIATTSRHSAQNIAFHEVGRQAIMADPDWMGGDYAAHGRAPAKGLAVARMAAHITYLSEDGLTARFGRRLQARTTKSFGFDADFQIESYLRHQGLRFVERFDANSYLTITRAMDYFDLADDAGGRLADAFAPSRARFCLVRFDTDWLYPTAASRVIVRALHAAARAVSFVELSAPHGHDSFLLDVPALGAVVDGFLAGAAA